MKIKELFTKDIYRPINGVIKVEQQDAKSIWQELDELVLTKELTGHLDKFLSVYSETLDSSEDSDKYGNTGVWVSGFFGSGKSHFIKALYYLFTNKEVEKDSTKKNALQFFEEKIDDALLGATVKKVVSKNTDTILFNIDSKADQSQGRDAILGVFLKVLNELQGYCPDYPHIAHMERYLDGKNLLDAFKEKYQSLTGEDWYDRRVEWQFHQDEIVKTLSEVLGQSEDSSRSWIDHADKHFSLTVENFSRWVKEFLDSKGSEHRIIFFVDEVGQFIGSDEHLMLNLQTIVENLGVVCKGRAWVVVTSQEDIDTVLGSFSNARTNDFSKILGRFKTRLSFSSSNTDEVIKKRLLEKKESSLKSLEKIYKPNADILKNQLTFTSNTGMTLLSYRDAQDFTSTYPFIPYQFKLLQKIFETIRKAGATGLHLSRGERSMLDAFQYAGQKAAEQEPGILVPIYWFYPTIESFLDTAVKRTIDQASPSQNPSLQDFDVYILQSLFMIRYLSAELKGNMDNLVTLCIDSIDADRFNLREKIEESLERLEKETLISKSGENYYFLTNEEQDISREIKNTLLEPGDESRELGKLIFGDILGDNKRHRYSRTGKDFDIIRMCDRQVFGSRIEKGLMLSIISSFCEDSPLFGQNNFISESKDNSSVIIKMPDDAKLAEELRTYLKTEKYISRSNDGNPETIRILSERKMENRRLKARLVELIKTVLTQADIYITGQSWQDGSEEITTLISRALDYLVDNTFSKMDYIAYPSTNHQQEIQSILRHVDSDSAGQIDLEAEENNPMAIKELRGYIAMYDAQSRQIVLNEIIEKFGARPYGWNEWEILLILVKLLCAGELQFILNSDIITNDRMYDTVSRVSNWRRIVIRRRKVFDPHRIEEARRLGQHIFGEMGPDREFPLHGFLEEKCNVLKANLSHYKTLSETGKYPGLDDIKEFLRLINIVTGTTDSCEFLERWIENKDALTDSADIFSDIEFFYTRQRSQWDALRDAYQRFNINRFDLERETTAQTALDRINEILQAPAPYEILKESEELINTVDKINDSLLKKARDDAKNCISEMVAEFNKEAKKIKADKTDISQEENVFKTLAERVQKEPSIANVLRAKDEAERILSEALDRIRSKTEQGEKPQPVKKTETINAKSLYKKTFIETDEDVDEFIDELAIKDGKRLRID
jgi:hypothetical protein